MRIWSFAFKKHAFFFLMWTVTFTVLSNEPRLLGRELTQILRNSQGNLNLCLVGNCYIWIAFAWVSYVGWLVFKVGISRGGVPLSWIGLCCTASAPVMHADQKQLEKDWDYFSLEKNSRQSPWNPEPGGRKWRRAHGGTQLSGLVFIVWSAHFLVNLRTTCSSMA